MPPLWAWLLMSFALGASGSLNAYWLLERYARRKRAIQIHVQGPSMSAGELEKLIDNALGRRAR